MAIQAKPFQNEGGAGDTACYGIDARDPRSPTMQRTLNLKVKYRESFRPFAPSVLRERVSDWFELDADSPYMLLVADVAKTRRREMTTEEKALFGIDKLNVSRSNIPAVTHVTTRPASRPCTRTPTRAITCCCPRSNGKQGVPCS